MHTFRFLEDLPDGAAAELCEFINAAAGHNVAPVSTEHLTRLNGSVIVALVQEEISGTIRIKSEPLVCNNYTLQQVGSLVVAKNYAGNGLGLELVQRVTTLVQHQQLTPFAFVNPGSQRIFCKANYQPIPAQQLPSNVSSAYGNPAVWLRD